MKVILSVALFTFLSALPPGANAASPICGTAISEEAQKAQDYGVLIGKLPKISPEEYGTESYFKKQDALREGFTKAGEAYQQAFKAALEACR